MKSEYNLPWFPFWVDPWNEDYLVRKLSREARLIFYDLLCLFWKYGGLLNNDDEELAFLLRVSVKEWQAAKVEVMAGGDRALVREVSAGKMLTNNLIATEYQDRSFKWVKKQFDGQQAALKRWGKNKKKSDS